MIRQPAPASKVSIALVVLVAACGRPWSTLEHPASADVPVPSQTRLERAVSLVELGAFAEAEARLRALASRCESGEEGRQALLLLSALQLDPRNLAATPDSAALLAARYLYLVDLDPVERPVAESLYLLALDLGADPGLRPEPVYVPDAMPRRYSDCLAPFPETARSAPLPILGREPRTVVVVRLQQRRDSLAARVEELGEANRALERRVADLDAELQRIHRLLRAGPDTPRVSGPGPR